MTANRRFLMLQGPHGPFFRDLAAMLTKAGHDTLRIGFNRGDQAFAGNMPYRPFLGGLEDWPGEVARLLDEEAITDVVMYGQIRPIHAETLRQAKARGLRTHLFEEGYLRPYWVTYERDGTTGHSPVVTTSIAQMRAALPPQGNAPKPVPATWGELRRHIALGAAYHAWVLLANGDYQGIPPHRSVTVWQEFMLYLKKLALLPSESRTRVRETRRLRRAGTPYTLALLQLEHDANYRVHSPFPTQAAFVTHVIEAFAAGAPPHHQLVFKAHPLEDGRAPVLPTLRDVAKRHGVSERVRYIPGGKLGPLLDMAKSVVTVNSTAAEQALWRGLPTRSFGRAVFDKPSLISHQPLTAFFEDPIAPDSDDYMDYRRYLLATSQIPGGFYSPRGRARILRRAVDMMLDPLDPYARIGQQPASGRQHLAVVR
ncbi:MAG: capsule biosynthesis protein CapA [Pseudomonadota bacterium]